MCGLGNQPSFPVATRQFRPLACCRRYLQLLLFPLHYLYYWNARYFARSFVKICTTLAVIIELSGGGLSVDLSLAHCPICAFVAGCSTFVRLSHLLLLLLRLRRLQRQRHQGRAHSCLRREGRHISVSLKQLDAAINFTWHNPTYGVRGDNHETCPRDEVGLPRRPTLPSERVAYLPTSPDPPASRTSCVTGLVCRFR